MRIMRAVGMPNGLSAVGYTDADCGTLAEGAWPQQRLLQNAPIEWTSRRSPRCSGRHRSYGDTRRVRAMPEATQLEDYR